MRTKAERTCYEADFVADQLKRTLRRDVKHSYHKILNIDEGRALNESVNNLMNNELNVVVYNFVDMLSHARTDMQMIRELASDDAAYRSLTYPGLSTRRCLIC
jgi:D-mannonate dehydratase